MIYRAVLARLGWPRVSSKFQIVFASLVFLFQVELASATQFGVSAVTQKSPAQITLSWDAAPWGTAIYNVYKSTTIGSPAGGNGSWTAIATGLTGTSYVDNNVQVGADYEYRIERTSSSFDGNTYVNTGIEVPSLENRGKLVLIVDNTYTTSLATEINQLITDLAGDGWVVLRHDVSRNDTPASVRSVIQADYYADTANVRAVYLLGHIPVLRSGSLNPDGHAARSMPADGYYGDMDGTWSNPSYIPSDIDLQVGRLDMFAMPAFLPSTDTDLMRQYLNRAHGWKHKQWTVATRQATMTAMTGDAIQRQFFGSTAPTVIPNNYYAGNGFYSPEFWNEIESKDYLWFTKGTGGGAYDACTGMGSTYHYAATPGVQTVFNAEFASYFEEWDVTNNFLRAPLAAKGKALTTFWSDNPTWVLIHMAMGKNIGFSTRISQNNENYYVTPGYTGGRYCRRGVHLGLMGDPSLRMHIVAPPSNLGVTVNGSSANLTWNASSDSSLLGYAIYRSATPTGPFTRLNSSLVSGTSFTDANANGGNFTYMVRAVKLEVSPSGSYQNLSQGIFTTVGDRPELATLVSQAAPVSFTVTYAAPNFASSSLAAQDVTLNKTGTASGTVAISGTGSTRTVTIQNVSGIGTLGISIPAGTAVDTSGNAFPASGPSATFVVDSTRARITSMNAMPNRTIHLSFMGVPGATYLIQANTNLSTTNWVTLDSRVATWEGTFQYDDGMTNGSRFYRTAKP